jgi:hypothetical protein
MPAFAKAGADYSVVMEDDEFRLVISRTSFAGEVERRKPSILRPTPAASAGETTQHGFNRPHRIVQRDQPPGQAAPFGREELVSMSVFLPGAALAEPPAAPPRQIARPLFNPPLGRFGSQPVEQRIDVDNVAHSVASITRADP